MHVGGKFLDGHDPFQLIFHELPTVVVVFLPLGKGGYQAGRHLGVDLVQFDDLLGKLDHMPTLFPLIRTLRR